MSGDRPSRTARKVALNVISLGAKPGMERILPPGIVDATMKLLAASGVVGARSVRFAHSMRAVSIYEAFDWMMPGQFEALGHRKAFFERQVRDAVGSGAEQVLVLGAGYDTMGWRLAPEFPNVKFFEIDNPATIHLKEKGIEKMGKRDNLFLIAEDLGRQKLVDVLDNNYVWTQSAKTIILAEGLLMYLPPEAVHDLLVQCASVSGPGSRIVFTYVSTGEDGRPDAGKWTGLTMWILRVSGEPWLWSIPHEELTGFLKASGWTSTTEHPGLDNKYGVEFYGTAEK